MQSSTQRILLGILGPFTLKIAKNIAVDYKLCALCFKKGENIAVHYEIYAIACRFFASIFVKFG